MFFFFKQKTAYEMRISDWSSDVCSSDLSSWTFWQRHGFERYGDLSEWGKITARRILRRSFGLPANLLTADIVIGFYPETATYGRGPVPPIASHRIRGSRLDDGTIMLERRVIGLCDDEPEGKDRSEEHTYEL